jgi:arginyl-tRNA synthetase
MTTDKYKEQFAASTAEAFRTVYAERFSEVGAREVFDAAFVANAVETPKDPKMGRFALPVFKYGKLLGDPPPAIVSKVSPEINRRLASSTPPSPVRCTGVGAFLNATIEGKSLIRDVLGPLLSAKSAYGDSTVGNNKVVLIEYSSPNIAKPFGVGHLRSTVIGNSLRRIFRKLGYAVTGINYPGDWGTQFGKMIVAYRKWGTPETMIGNVVKNLVELYVKFHEEAERDSSLEDAARVAFKDLETGEPEAVRLWDEFKKISNEEFDRIYGILGVEFDLVYGESFLNDKMEAVIARLEKLGLTSVSRGALIVELNDPNLPPALLKKQDGATLYLTRDLAGAYYRWERYKYDRSIYVVGAGQADHFRQMIKVMALVEDKEGVSESNRISTRISHVEFGWIRFGDQTMSTRRGNTVLLEDVLNQAVSLARERIQEKNPELANTEATAELIGVGAVIFSQLAVRRQRDVNFVWEDVLNFDGETGPYLQYTHARLSSLIRNYGRPIVSDFDAALLDREEELRVVELLSDFGKVLEDCVEHCEPYFMTSYLLDLAGAFNKLYQRKDSEGRIDKIVSDNAPLSTARMALVSSVRTVLAEGLRLLGLKAPEEM